MSEKIKGEIITVLSDLLKERNIEYEDIKMDIPLSEEGIGLDSTSRLVFLGNIEEHFNFEIPEKYWGNKTFDNLNELYKFIESSKIN